MHRTGMFIAYSTFYNHGIRKDIKLSRSAIALIHLMIEYCQFSVDIPNLTFDVMTRLIELFKVIFYFDS